MTFRLQRSLALLLLAIAVPPAFAQTVVTSTGPDRVAVTVYRAPFRDPSEAFDLEWLDGYALISETRRIEIPAGMSEIRFEGVAGGIIPQSAIVTGVPDGIVERNRDAWLLSAASLIERSLGRRVHLRRISRATGAVREHDAIVRSGADGALVLQTAEGFEALRCTGQNETPIFDEVPAGLSARPTLSIRTRSRQAVTATVTLSYLASGFDWQANYVANLSADGSHVDLFAWLTLASSDETSFRDAETQAVAGRLNREEVERESPEAPSLQLLCWPAGTTSDLPAPQQALVTDGVAEEVTFQGTTRTEDLINSLPQAFAGNSRRATQENLGDLKLYRITEPVTVAARSQKQVAFLIQPNVQVRTVYRSRIEPHQESEEPEEATRLLLTRNRTQEGLGLPLPGGGVQLFTEGAGRPILLGEGSVEDRAIGEDVEIGVGQAPGVTTWVTEERQGGRRHDYLLTVTNDGAEPAPFEAEFNLNDEIRFRPRVRLGTRHGRPIWAVTVPANGSATLRYRVIEDDE
ncbi:MAG TPA: hypothetical protein VIT38_06580 [Allosphingosinicella sp.]